MQAMNYLSLAGFGAKLLGVFANGMVQSFIFGVTLEPRGIFLNSGYCFDF
jgi:ethanolamine kinase